MFCNPVMNNYREIILNSISISICIALTKNNYLEYSLKERLDGLLNLTGPDNSIIKDWINYEIEHTTLLKNRFNAYSEQFKQNAIKLQTEQTEQLADFKWFVETDVGQVV